MEEERSKGRERVLEEGDRIKLPGRKPHKGLCAVIWDH